MVNAFLNRVDELAALDEIGARPGGQLIAVIGRRRIGKTALLVRWLEKQRREQSVYWVAYRSTSAVLLASFSRALQPLLGTSDPDFSFSSWEAALAEVARLAKTQALFLVIDELPYLLESEPAFATVLQAAWDHALSGSQIRLVVAGSQYAMMSETFASPRGALFGRATANLLVDDLTVDGMGLFLPRYSREQLVETYSVVGGVPKYLEMWTDGRPVLHNIREVLLSSTTVFRNEPSFLIHDEIAEPRTYVAILESIAGGTARPVDIAAAAGINATHVNKYLHTLQTLRLTRRIVSAEAGSSKSRAAKYEIRDPYLRFHFAFVQPNLALLEQGRVDRVMDVIRTGFDSHVGRVGYEELCRRWVAARADAGALPFEALQVGRLWDRRAEIDVAALDLRGRVALVGECRWRSRRMPEATLDTLQAKARSLSKLRGFHLHFALFSRGGFTRALERRAAREGVLLVKGVPEAGQERTHPGAGRKG